DERGKFRWVGQNPLAAAADCELLRQLARLDETAVICPPQHEQIAFNPERRHGCQRRQESLLLLHDAFTRTGLSGHGHLTKCEMAAGLRVRPVKAIASGTAAHRPSG